MEGDKDALEILDQRISKLEREVAALLHVTKEAQELVKWTEDLLGELRKLNRI